MHGFLFKVSSNYGKKYCSRRTYIVKSPGRCSATYCPKVEAHSLGSLHHTSIYFLAVLLQTVHFKAQEITIHFVGVTWYKPNEAESKCLPSGIPNCDLVDFSPTYCDVFTVITSSLRGHNIRGYISC